MIIVLLGLPGSGKGTIAKKMVSDFGFCHVSTGDIFRETIKTNTPLAEKVRNIVNSGALVPDDIVNEVVAQKLNSLPKNQIVMLDGYPRTAEQANFLDKISPPKLVVLVKAKEDLIVKRISGRWLCPQCGRIYNTYFEPPKVAGICDFDQVKLIQRKDDNEESIKLRLALAKKSTIPLVDHYDGKIVEVDTNDGADATWPVAKTKIIERL